MHTLCLVLFRSARNAFAKGYTKSIRHCIEKKSGIPPNELLEWEPHHHQKKNWNYRKGNPYNLQ